MSGTGLYERIYAVVRRIPAGRVATYGQIAKLAGRCGARQVGYALAALSEGSGVPWQRIINSQGRISLRSSGGHDVLQRELLEEEGVEFSLDGRVDLARFGWKPQGSQTE
jgi:methylated-DNA-protein-cysteine methyltransferase-like protein